MWFEVSIISLLTLAIGRYKDSCNSYMLAWAFFVIIWVSTLFYQIYMGGESVLTIGGIVVFSLYLMWLSYEDYTLVPRLTSMVLFSGSFFVFFSAPGIKEYLIETVAIQTKYVISLFEIPTEIVTGPEGYQSKIIISNSVYNTYITFACTGFGAISGFIGLFISSKIGLFKKIAWSVSVALVVYILNIVRNVFVAFSYSFQLFHFDFLVSHLNISKPMISFYIAHTVISKSLSVAVIIGLLLMIAYIEPDIKRFLVVLIDKGVSDTKRVTTL